MSACQQQTRSVPILFYSIVLKFHSSKKSNIMYKDLGIAAVVVSSLLASARAQGGAGGWFAQLIVFLIPYTFYHLF